MLLVTGGAGFIGANFVLDAIATTGEPIVVLDQLTYAANPANLDTLAADARLELIVGDIGDRPLVRSLLTQHQPRAVIHFAAESHVDRSIAESDAFIRTNVMGTHALHRTALTALPRQRATIWCVPGTIPTGCRP